MFVWFPKQPMFEKKKLILMLQHPGYWFPSIHVIGDAEMMGHPNMGIFMMAI